MTDHRNSRRHFIRDASLLSAAAGLGATAAVGANANLADEAVRCKIGGNRDLKPDISTPGVVVVPMDKLIFLTYCGAPALDPTNQGTVVIALEGCFDWKFRSPGDEESAAHPLDLEALDFCQAYRVKRSTWVATVEQSTGRQTPRLRHHIFTFLGLNPGVTHRGTHFECLSQAWSFRFFKTKSFDRIMNYMTIANAAA